MGMKVELRLSKEYDFKFIARMAAFIATGEDQSLPSNFTIEEYKDCDDPFLPRGGFTFATKTTIWGENLFFKDSKIPKEKPVEQANNLFEFGIYSDYVWYFGPQNLSSLYFTHCLAYLLDGQLKLDFKDNLIPTRGGKKLAVGAAKKLAVVDRHKIKHRLNKLWKPDHWFAIMQICKENVYYEYNYQDENIIQIYHNLKNLTFTDEFFNGMIIKSAGLSNILEKDKKSGVNTVQKLQIFAL